MTNSISAKPFNWGFLRPIVAVLATLVAVITIVTTFTALVYGVAYAGGMSSETHTTFDVAPTDATVVSTESLTVTDKSVIHNSLGTQYYLYTNNGAEHKVSSEQYATVSTGDTLQLTTYETPLWASFWNTTLLLIGGIIGLLVFFAILVGIVCLFA